MSTHNLQSSSVWKGFTEPSTFYSPRGKPTSAHALTRLVLGTRRLSMQCAVRFRPCIDIHKDVVRRFGALESHIQGRVPVYPVATKFKTNNKADATRELMKNTDSLTATFEDVNVSDQGALSKSRTSREESNLERQYSGTAKSNKADFLPVIVRYPLRTESAMRAMVESNTLVFAVDKRADKKTIKDAVEKMLMTRARKVNTVIMPDGTKKAYVKLAPDCNASDVATKIKIF